jgi:hypothetical protein
MDQIDGFQIYWPPIEWLMEADGQVRLFPSASISFPLALSVPCPLPVHLSTRPLASTQLFLYSNLKSPAFPFSIFPLLLSIQLLGHAVGLKKASLLCQFCSFAPTAADGRWL